MLASGDIEEDQTESESTVLLTLKKHDTPPFCIDYQRLNELAVCNSYPIPRIDECIDSLRDSKLFTTLDGNSGFWQVRVDERDPDKNSFTSIYGMYRFKRMPLGFKNAPGTFPRAINEILTKVKWQYALAFQEDVIIFSTDGKSHFMHAATVLQMIHLAGLSSESTFSSTRRWIIWDT